MRKWMLLPLLGLCVAHQSFADGGNTTHQVQTVMRHTQITADGVSSPMMSSTKFSSMSVHRQKIIAGIFNLSVEEYQQYLHYMDDSMDGYEYQHNTNPNLILAMHTHDKSKYRQYIKNAVIEDHDAIARILKVSNDYTRVAKEVYPNELPIMTPQIRAHMNHELQAGDVAQLYCDINAPSCANLLGIVLPKVMKIHGVTLDIFAVGQINKINIVSFAKRNGISPQLVDSHKVTLNYGSSAFHALEQQAHKKLTLPFLLVRRNGVEIPVNLGSVS